MQAKADWIVKDAYRLLLVVVALDQAVSYTSVYENVTAGCLSGGVCCNSKNTTTLLDANTTAYTAYHMDVPRTYRQAFAVLPTSRLSCHYVYYQCQVPTVFSLSRRRLLMKC